MKSIKDESTFKYILLWITQMKNYIKKPIACCNLDSRTVEKGFGNFEVTQKLKEKEQKSKPSASVNTIIQGRCTQNHIRYVYDSFLDK